MLKYKTDFMKLFGRLSDAQEEEVRDWILPHVPARIKGASVREEQKRSYTNPP